MVEAASVASMTVTAPPHRRLLAANGGCWEGLFIRPGLTLPMRFSEPPLVVTRQTNGACLATTPCWTPQADVEVTSVHSAPGQGPVRATLTWRPEPGLTCRIERSYSPYGLLEPLPPV